jgi:FkbM family methyltransferase
MNFPANIPIRAINKVRRMFLNSFLRQVRGVIHVGAHAGEERNQYSSRGLDVVWVEPNPVVFERLCLNISGLVKQRAYRYLLAADDGKEYTFHISNNDGASSSILDFAKHQEVWPEVTYTHDICIAATTLDRMMDKEQIDVRGYGALVLDTQGSELLVLRGAVSTLKHFRFVKTEAADFEVYAGCCQLAELTDFMHGQGFELSRKYAFNTTGGVGSCYDVVYRRR